MSLLPYRMFCKQRQHHSCKCELGQFNLEWLQSQRCYRSPGVRPSRYRGRHYYNFYCLEGYYLLLRMRRDSGEG
jgi:hypothetical protein